MPVVQKSLGKVWGRQMLQVQDSSSTGIAAYHRLVSPVCWQLACGLGGVSETAMDAVQDSED